MLSLTHGVSHAGGPHQNRRRNVHLSGPAELNPQLLTADDQEPPPTDLDDHVWTAALPEIAAEELKRLLHPLTPSLHPRGLCPLEISLAKEGRNGESVTVKLASR